ncbi:MAG: MFS transporter [Verrucomicrobia bacterium]|nr:MFS transporter [Verrucomicrobiota bacterium]
MSRTRLFPVYLIYFLDTFSFAIVFPLFSSLILTSLYDFLPETISLSHRDILLGILTAAFPLGLFLGAPFIGNFADRRGRKFAFYITITGILAGSLLTVCALALKAFYFLIFSRLLTGFFSGNMTLCLASITDLSQNPKVRAKNYGLLTGLGGLSWLAAMIIGGELSDPRIFPAFNPTIPFFFAAGGALINLIILSLYFKETSRPHAKHPFQFNKAFHNLVHAFSSSHHRTLYLVLLFFAIGWMIIMQWFSGYSLERYHVGREQLVLGLISIGLCWTLAGAILNRPLINRITLPNIPLIFLFVLAVLLFLSNRLSSTDSYSSFILINSIAAAAASIILSNLLNLISLSANRTIQGETMGFSQSVLALAQFISPLAGGMILSQKISYFYLSAALVTSIAFLIFFKEFRSLTSNKR